MIGAGGEAGLTLVEMLVVLAIVAVAAGATVLGIGSATRAPGAEAEARRLAATMQAAADAAMFGGGDALVTLAADARGYRIIGARGVPAARHELAGGLRLSGMGRDPVPLAIDGTGVPVALVLAGPGVDWTVRYDGLRATAAAMP